MRHLIFSILLLAGWSVTAFSQKSKILNKTEIQQLMDEMGSPSMPLLRAYEYQDKNGVYELLLCENQNEIKGNDTFNTKIEAVCYINDHGGYMDQWKISDFIDTKNNASDEKNIWFWTKYCSVTDIDQDKAMDPVIVFGTKTADNEYKQIKIITLYKGKKYAIRATECDLDDCRSFKKDESIKTLPPSIQSYLNTLLERIRKEQGVLLKNG